MESKIATLATSLSQGQQKKNKSKVARATAKTPGPSTPLHPRVVQAMSKFTGVLKHKVVQYIRLLKQVEEPPQVINQDGWINTFILALSADVFLSPLDVLIWIKKFPQIFTPKVVRMLRDYYNRIRQIVNENYTEELFNSSDEDEDEDMEITEDEFSEWGLKYEVSQADILALK